MGIYIAGKAAAVSPGIGVFPTPDIRVAYKIHSIIHNGTAAYPCAVARIFVPAATSTVCIGRTSAVKKAAIDEGCRDNIPETLVDRVILKELKTAKEQLDTCPPERTDLLAEYQLRHDVIQEYAPALMSQDEVQAYITEKFAEIVATKNKGQVMKAVMAELKGKADGKVINQVVAELCK